MGKHNPLFADSTLLRGHEIRTVIELHGVMLYEGESLYLVMINSEGQEKYARMRDEVTHFEVMVLLSHEVPAHFYFGVESDQKLLFRSLTIQRVPRYTLIETWAPANASHSSLITRPRTEALASATIQETSSLESLGEAFIVAPSM